MITINLPQIKLKHENSDANNIAILCIDNS